MFGILRIPAISPVPVSPSPVSALQPLLCPPDLYNTYEPEKILIFTLKVRYDIAIYIVGLLQNSLLKVDIF